MSNKLIIFDFDGTIADSMWAWDALGRETMEENHIPVPEDYEHVIRTMSVPNYAAYLSEKHPVLGTAEHLMALWHERMVYNYCNRIRLKPGILPFLDALKEKGYTLYLASATHYKVLMEAVKYFDLEKYFAFVITEEIVGLSKRDPKIYQMCMEKAGTDLHSTYLFEDANHAVRTAKTLGLHVCGIADHSMRAHVDQVRAFSDLYVEDFRDLRSLMAFVEQN